MNGLVLILIGVYLVQVLRAGNGPKLLDELSREQGFAPWAVASGSLWYIYRSKTFGELPAQIAFTALVAAGLIIGPDFFEFVNAQLKGRGNDNAGSR
ncbi:MAG: hypothetical protein ACREBU_00500 [Nitrososphaera sp.]